MGAEDEKAENTYFKSGEQPLDFMQDTIKPESVSLLFPMYRSITLALFYTFIATVSAKNDTVVQGWHSEPHERGTWSIVWGCLATIFICTWSVLHLKVPRRGKDDWKDDWKRFYSKVLWTLFATIAPEVFLASAFEDDSSSRRLKQVLNTRPEAEGVEEWTLTHTRFALANGFVYNDGSIWMWDPSEGFDDISMIPPKPPVSGGELKSRSKSDWTTKTVALFQITWFAVQLLVRAIQHLHITPFEILTLAFIICSVVTYGLYWNQPQNVDYPVSLLVDPPKEDLHEEVPPEEDRLKGGQPGEEPQATRANRDESGSDVAADAFHSPRNSQSTAGAVRDLEIGSSQSPPHRDATLAVSKRKIEAIDKGYESFKYTYQVDIGPYQVNIGPVLSFIITGSAFGAMHCLAWNSTFPTPQERLAWRICCVATTSLPTLFALGLYLDDFLDAERWTNPGFSLLFMGCYIIARITIIVLALMALRALSADDLHTTTWNNLIPHFGV